MFAARPFVVLGLGAMVCMAATAWPAAAWAQQIYRIVTPDGRVTFSDRPPADAAAKAAPAPVVPLGGAAGSDTASLPFELRQAAAAYPVTLYTGPECPPCQSARAMLTTRGIPFAEKTVTTNEDIEALRRRAGSPTLPVATIGGQQLRGYSEQEWAQYLDAAGYPQTSQLPPGFRPAPGTPALVRSTLWKASKARSSSSGERPGPVSAISISRHSASSRLTARRVPPGAPIA